MNLSTREGIEALVKRARLQNLTLRADDLEDVHAMLNGTYSPPAGWIAPGFDRGSSREEAWQRALRTVTPAAPLVVSKTIAGLDFGSTTWSDAERQGERVDELLSKLDLPSLARAAAIEYRTAGVVAAMASIPETEDGQGEPILSILRGVNVPYTDPRDHATITGWYRAVQYVDPGSAKLVWWVEVYDLDDPERTIHRIWRSLEDPIELGSDPEEFESTARPRFAIYDLQPDGLPVSPLLANMGRIMGLYATELRLAASEEMSAFPMLLLKGNPEWDGVGPAEVIVSDSEPGAGAEWLAPGDLEQLREQVRLKRDQVREAFNLPGGALGSQTPSGEALAEANRGFMQESHRTADAISRVLTDAVGDYLELHGLPRVTVSVPIDRAYTTATELELVEKGLDLGVLAPHVAARKFQQFMGSGAYSDEELAEFVASLRERTIGRETGELFNGDA
jgi:hypothetical protein